MARQAGVSSDEADEPATDGDDRLRELLNCAPDVAAALLGLKSAACKPLHGAGEQAALAYADGGSVGVWAAELLGVADPVPRRTLQAARFCAACGVQAWQRLVGQTGDQPGGQAMDRLSSRCATCSRSAASLVRGQKAPAGTPPTSRASSPATCMQTESSVSRARLP